MKRIALAVTSLALALSAVSAEAQEAPRQSIAINPVGAVIGIYMAEIERSVLPNASVGLSSSYFSVGMRDEEEDTSVNVSYLTVDGIVRYYPGGSSLRGFSVGGTIGYAALTGSLKEEDGKYTERAHAFAAGVVADYNWLVRERFLIGTGIGAKHLVPIGISGEGLSLTYPTLRLSIGYAF